MFIDFEHVDALYSDVQIQIAGIENRPEPPYSRDVMHVVQLTYRAVVLLCSRIANIAARIVIIVASALITSPANAEAGVFDNRIVFGQSAALNGPAAELGRDMREGILAAFNEINETGGVHDRKLQLISYDDGYEPERAITNVL
ncbi:MAG: ABC transporter substrate-binding protein, partial [Nitrococcus sp.]|nr:ABC transporter substrate-binding protein [Nitrococcus sp.]